MSSARKIKLRLAQRKPRNPLALPAAQRKAGAHRKSGKAQRQRDKQVVRRALHPLSD